MALISLAVMAFLAATLLPVSSEILLLALIIAGDYSVFVLVLVASVANTLGSCVNYGLGWQLQRFRTQRWFYFNDRQIAQANYFFERYGQWALGFAWLPVVGDALTLVAGIVRMRFTLFVVWVLLGKTLRYALLAYGVTVYEGAVN